MTTTFAFDEDDELRRKREEKDRERELRQSWKEFYAEVDRRLDAVRPERVGQGEYEWREPVYGWVRNHLPDEANLIRRTAKAEVDRREVQATKRGNNFLRAWMHGQAPLSWKLVGPLPIVVDKVRIRLDVASPEDVENAARQLLKRGTQTFQEVQLLVTALGDLARAARKEGFARVSRLGDMAPRKDDDDEDFWLANFDELDWSDGEDEE